MRSPSRPARLLAAAAAGTLLLGVSLAGTATATTSASPSPGEKVVLTVGMTEDIDSANPFTGIAAVSTRSSRWSTRPSPSTTPSDFHIVPGLAESWQESADHTTWTYKIRSGLTWSDGVPLTAKDAAYSFNRVINGQYERTNYGSYVDNITKAVATDDTTLVLTVKQPSPIMEKLLVYIIPEHIWKSIDEKAVKSYPNEGTPSSPTVGSGPFTMVERKVGQFIRMQANPTFYRGKPAVDEVVFKIYKNQDALGQALKKGEIDFADSLESNVFKSLEGQPGITTLSATYSGFNELAFNTGAALDDGTPDRRRQPAAQGQGAAPGAQLVGRPPGHGRQGPRRRRHSGHDDRPADVREPAPRPGQPVHLRPGEGQDAARRRRLQGRVRRHPGRLEGQPAVVPPLRPHRLLGQQLAEGRAVPQGLLQRRRRRGEDQDDRERQPHRRSSARASSTCSSGAGSSSRTRTTSCRPSPAPTGPTRTATRSTPTCRTRSTATRRTTRSSASRASRPTSRSGPTSSSRCSRCSTTTRRTSSPTTTTTLRPTARTASPAS